MPREFVKCVEALIAKGKGKDSAYAICTAAYKDRHGGRTPQEDHSKHYEYFTVASMENVVQVQIKDIDQERGIVGAFKGEKLLQYGFDFLNLQAKWTTADVLQYIKKHSEVMVIQSTLKGYIEQNDPVRQDSYLSAETLSKLKAVDPDPFFVPIHITYGLGSRKQFFDKEFFEKAGPKFEGTPFMINHSDLAEFGKAIPIGSIVKFAGADDTKATFISYVSGSEGTLRQKIRESQALGNLGFVKKVSIEGIPVTSDFTKTPEYNHFHDLAHPTGIAIVIKEGLKGSGIGG